MKYVIKNISMITAILLINACGSGSSAGSASSSAQNTQTTQIDSEADPVETQEGSTAEDDSSDTYTDNSDDTSYGTDTGSLKSLKVKGWPSYVAMGTVTDNASSLNTKLSESKVDAIFKYAGNGFGNRGEVIDPSVTLQTIKQARDVEKIASGKVMPTMVVYTANGSGGGVAPEDILEYKNLLAHMRTLIRMCVSMQQQKDMLHPYPATIVLNADLFGEWQKGKTYGNFQESYCGGTDDRKCSKLKVIPIRKAMKEAIDLEKSYSYNNQATVATLYDLELIKNKIDEDIQDTIKGWVDSQNFIIKTFSENVPFGWVINLWNPGSALWVHNDYPKAAKEPGKEVADFVHWIGAYKASDYRPDFLVFDKYERDGFGAAGKPAYAFGSKEWKNYLLYVKYITDSVKTPAMLWQIPGGHMVSKQEDLSGEARLCSDNDTNGCFRHLDSGVFGGHSASGGSFFMGDAKIGKNIENIREDVLDISLSPAVYHGADNVRALLEQDKAYDWSKPALDLVIDANAFSILWGGGETTGAVAISTNQTGGYAWLARKIKAYEESKKASIK